MTTMRSAFTMALAASPIFLALAYLWGYAFHQGYFSEWGFNPDLFPLTPAEVYIQAYWAGVEVVVLPLHWLAQTPLLQVMAWILASLGFVVVAAWISTRRPVLQWWRRDRRRSGLEPSPAEMPFFWRRLSRWVLLSCKALLTILLGLMAFALFVLLITGMPLEAGKKHAREAWNRKAYEGRPQVTFVGADAKSTPAYLVDCSERWCGVIQDGRAVVIPSSQVKRIDSAAPTVQTNR